MPKELPHAPMNQESSEHVLQQFLHVRLLTVDDQHRVGSLFKKQIWISNYCFLASSETIKFGLKSEAADHGQQK